MSMFQNPQPNQSKNSILAKRQQFRTELRRQHLQQLFSSKRKERMEFLINQRQREVYLKKIDQLLYHFYTVEESKDDALKAINKIHQELCRDDVDFRQAVKVNSEKLLRTFILYPDHSNSILILHIMLDSCYEQTFGVDDQKFSLIDENGQQVYIQKHQFTIYQLAIETLFNTIDKHLNLLGSLRKPQTLKNQNEPLQINWHIQQTQKKIKACLSCFKNLLIHMNLFLFRHHYIHKYFIDWIDILMKQPNFCKKEVGLYLTYATNFWIPFKSFDKNVNQSALSIQQNTKQTEIVKKLFSLCTPEGSSSEYKQQIKPAIWSFLAINNLFRYMELRIQRVIEFFPLILRLTRVMFVHRKFFPSDFIRKIFEIQAVLIAKINNVKQNQNCSDEAQRLMNQTDILQQYKKMQFLVTFDLYLKTQTSFNTIPVYHVLLNLIEYCVVFSIHLQQILCEKDLFGEMMHNIGSNYPQITLINLKILQIVCQYAKKFKKNHFFAKMITFGVDMTLNNLVYSQHPWIKENAIFVVDNYFSEDQIYEYTELESQLERYECEKQMEQREERVMIPNRREDYIYQI